MQAPGALSEPDVLRSPRTVVTPEAVVLDLPIAGVGSRSLGALLDFTAYVVVAASMLWVTTQMGIDPSLTLLVLLLILFIVVPAVIETLTNGRSLGKWALGLRIVTVEGAPVTASRAFLRSVLMSVDLLLSLGFLGAATGFLSDRSQRLGDLAAGTVAIRERLGPSSGRLPVPTGAVCFVPAADWVPFARSLDTSRLDPATQQLIRRFLLRYPTLEGDARGRLAVALAEDTAARLRFVPPTLLEPVEFLTAVAAAQQLRVGATDGVPFRPATVARAR